VGILVAYPQGLENSWNAGVCCGAAVTNDHDDVGFIRAMLAAIAAEGAVDRSRVYVSGLSNGGAMTQRLACEAANVFAAAAPLAFPTPYTDFASQCQPSRRLSVLSFMGLTDVVVPYANGTFGGALESFASWRAKNGCGPEPVDEHVDIGSSYCDYDRTCGGDSDVGLCSIRGSALPPPNEGLSGHVLYLNDDSIVLVDLIWDFFLPFGLPEPLPASGRGGLATIVGLLLVAALFALTRDRRRAGLTHSSRSRRTRR